MTLTLTVLRCPDAVAPETRKVSGGEFSIGRAPDNDWVLPDPDRLLSKRHCILAYRRGTWQIAGTSTNGTFLNRDRDPIERGPPRPVQDGDRITIGHYEIEVGLGAERRQFDSAFPSASPSNPFADDPFAANPHASPGPVLREDEGAPSVLLPSDFDPLAPDPAASGEEFIGPTHDDHQPSVTEAIHLPSPRAVLPANWDVDLSAPARDAQTREAETPASPQTPPAPPLAAPAAPAAPQPDLFVAFLRGARMEIGAPADPERTIEQLGAAFRALVCGLRQVLIARAAVKNEFRIEQTVIQRRGNNPLKFSSNDDDALAALLGIGRHLDMTPEAAVAEALTDVRLHELASIMAMQAAARALLTRLSPDVIRRASERGVVLPIPAVRKGRAWDAFEALYSEIAQGLTDDFDSVFGKSFARAYEQAMTELANRDRRE